MTKGSGLSRGDKRRNAKLAELRRLVPVDNAILGIDLADKKQAVVVCDHDSRVLARRRCVLRPGIWARYWTGLRCRAQARIRRCDGGL